MIKKLLSNKLWLSSILISIALIFVLEGTIFYGYSTITRKQNLAVTSFIVPEGASVRWAIDEMVKRHWIAQGFFLKAYVHFYPELQLIKAGEYEFSGRYSPLDILVQLRAGQSIKRHSVQLTEGMTVAEFKKILWVQDQLIPSLKENTDAQILEKLAIPETHLEGLFFPDTYFYSGNTTDADLLKRAYYRMQQMLAEAWSQRAPNLPYATPYQALILASIVEKEAKLPKEQPIIAGVFLRRLAKGMRLQTDPTVIYGLGSEFHGNLTRAHLLSDTPYNTYTRAGLPPTPIAAPGRSAIHAVLHPALGTALYFVAKGDGSHYFSTTLSEHEQAVRKYQLGQ